MADPCRLKILDSIDAHLQGITIANGYKNDVGADSVFWYISHDPFVPTGKLPLIQFAPAADSLSLVTQQPSEHLETHMNVNVVFWAQTLPVSTDRGRDASVKIANGIDDIKYAMLSSDIIVGTEPAYRKGGNATQTLLLSVFSDEGDWLRDDSRRLVKVVMRFQVWFQETTDRS